NVNAPPAAPAEAGTPADLSHTSFPRGASRERQITFGTGRNGQIAPVQRERAYAKMVPHPLLHGRHSHVATMSLFGRRAPPHAGRTSLVRRFQHTLARRSFLGTPHRVRNLSPAPSPEISVLASVKSTRKSSHHQEKS